MTPEQLLSMATRWPWKWFLPIKEAAVLCQIETGKFEVLKEQQQLLLLERSDLQKQCLDIAKLREEGKSLRLERDKVVAENKTLKDEFDALCSEHAALISEEARKVSTLKESNHLLTLENAELQKQRLSDAERHQTLRDDHQFLKAELSEANKQRSAAIEREKLLSIELEQLRSEHKVLIGKYNQVEGTVPALFEHIRRLKNGVDDRGNDIPALFRR